MRTNPSGVIVNTATAGTATTAPVTSNTTTHTKKTDLAITKTGPGAVASAATPSPMYLVVSNSNQSSADGAVVADRTVDNFNFDAAGGATISCITLSGGAVCPSGADHCAIAGGGRDTHVPEEQFVADHVERIRRHEHIGGRRSPTWRRVVAPQGLVDSNTANNTATKVTTHFRVPDAGAHLRRPRLRRGRDSWFEWETVSEVRTAGFNVVRMDSSRGGYVRVNPRLLPALIGARHGGVYRFADPTAVAGGTYTYGVEEVEITGKVRHYGPYTVTYGARSAPAVAHEGALARAQAPARRQAQRRPAAIEKKAHTAKGRSAPADPVAATQPQAKAGSSPATQRGADPGRAGRPVHRDRGPDRQRAGQVGHAGEDAGSARRQLRLQQKGQAVAWKADPTGDKPVLLRAGAAGHRRRVHALQRVLARPGERPAMKVVTGTAPAPAPASAVVPVHHSRRGERAGRIRRSSSDPDADFWYWDTPYAFESRDWVRRSRSPCRRRGDGGGDGDDSRLPARGAPI